MTAAGDWPRTGRVLPWLLAVFLCFVWLVPTEAVELAIPLPVDPHPDRLLVLAIALLAVATAFAGGQGRRGLPAPTFTRMLLVFAAVALASLALNADRLANLGELDQGMKQIVVLAGYIVLFYVVATVLRPSELRKFAVLIVALATIAGVGTLWEYRTDFNVFYDVADDLFSSVATVAPAPTLASDSREDTFGPTEHGLVITTMLAMAMPFAVLGLIRAKGTTRKILYGLAVAVLLAGGLATLRKTSMLAPVAGLMVLAAYRPREMVRLAPFGVVLLVFVHFLAPGALGSVSSQFTGGFLDSDTTIGRTADYEAVQPDIATHPLSGRGYGTLDISRADTYRILDNQYLGQLVQVGFIGLAALIALLVAGLALAHRVAQHAQDADHRLIGLASMSAFVSFGVASALFDLFSFSQNLYLFFFLAGMCSVAAASAPSAARAPPLETRPARPVPIT
jgi:O-antigen ligase